MRRERGIALVSVLWGVAILSLIAAALLSLSLTSAQLDRNAWNRARAASAADGAVNQAILALLDPRLKRQPRVDSTPADVVFDHVKVRVAIQDESGRINVNFASKDLIAAALAASGLSPGDARTLAGRIAARRGPEEQLIAKTTYRARDELLAIDGLRRETLDRAAPLITVFGRNDSVNQSVAPRAVLAVLPGLDADAVDRILKERAARQSQLADSDDDASGAPLGASNAVFRITADATLDPVHVHRIAEVLFTGDAAKPWLILDWR
ncbi:MAG: general secretion pathway protein GspK [Proteobacteria bacterium]|nr:general secretion pathway protein GspK [Pseudomonadota bacterium]